MKSKVYNKREFIKLIEKNGYHKKRDSGGHSIYKNEEEDSIVLGNNLNSMIARRLIKEHNLKGE